MSKRLMVIPDTQVRPNDDLEYLERIGKYAVDMLPDIIVMLGDFADMPSLSSHDKAGSKSMEGQRYKADIKVVHEAMDKLLNPIRQEQQRRIDNHKPRWNPRMVMLYGNHENRINRAIDNDPKLDGLISLEDLKYEEAGWETVPFLQPIIIEGIAFCHYFVAGVMGRPCGTARALLAKHHQSCIAGHQQGRDIAFDKDATGRQMTALICGSYYQHDEDYMDYQSNKHWRGLYVLHEVDNGSFDELAVSLKYLKRKYGNTSKRVTPTGRKGVSKTGPKVPKDTEFERLNNQLRATILKERTKQTTKRGVSK